MPPRPTGPAATRADDVRGRVAVSAWTTESTLTPDPLGWLDERRRQPFESSVIELAELLGPQEWRIHPESGNLEHSSGRYFSVEGLHARIDDGRVREWRQPILVQRDIAVLGMLAKEFDGVLHFLVQAKMEPGNAGLVQLSPTVQATSSNYTRVHRGRPPRYVEYFTRPGAGRVLVDALQSEQGAWFHRKRNRNTVVEVTGEVPEHDDFRWLTLGQILRLLRQRGVVNMDARTVLGCLPLPDPVAEAEPDLCAEPEAAGPRSMTDVLSWFTGRKCATALSTRLVPLDSVPGWRRDDRHIAPVDGEGFSIVGVRVDAASREVRRWRQPLLAPHGTAMAGLLVRRLNGRLHALVRAEVLPGHRDVVELGPTVRYPWPVPDPGPGGRSPEFLDRLLSDTGVLHDSVLSEEGGRFLSAQTRYRVVEADDVPARVPPDFAWISVRRLRALQRHSYHLGIEARTLLLCLNSR